MISLNGWKDVLIVVFVASFLFTVQEVGQPRKVLTHSDAVRVCFFSALLIYITLRA